MPGRAALKRPRKRRARKSTRRYPNAQFQFLDWNRVGNPKVVHLRGAVTVTRQKMMLEVDDSGDKPYVVPGTRRGTIFAGRYQRRSVRVRAKWFEADVGDAWVGLWIENSTEYVFLFHLRPPEPPNASISLENFEWNFDDADFERLTKLPELRKRFRQIGSVRNFVCKAS
jgi:hypothetical protein